MAMSFRTVIEMERPENLHLKSCFINVSEKVIRKTMEE